MTSCGAILLMRYLAEDFSRLVRGQRRWRLERGDVVLLH